MRRARSTLSFNAASRSAFARVDGQRSERNLTGLPAASSQRCGLISRKTSSPPGKPAPAVVVRDRRERLQPVRQVLGEVGCPLGDVRRAGGRPEVVCRVLHRLCGAADAQPSGDCGSRAQGAIGVSGPRRTIDGALAHELCSHTRRRRGTGLSPIGNGLLSDVPRVAFLDGDPGDPTAVGETADKRSRPSPRLSFGLQGRRTSSSQPQPLRRRLTSLPWACRETSDSGKLQILEPMSATCRG